MKKGYYIHFQGRQSVGVSKKIDMQMEELSKKYDMQEIEIDAIPRNLLQRLIGLLPSASISRKYEEALEKLKNPAFIYVRRTVADKAYCDFWKKIKKRYPQCKIIIEIFTYPYNKDDFAKWNAWPFYFKELLYRGKLKSCVDRFVTYTRDDIIFGIPTICTTNGIKVDAEKIVQGEFSKNQITMIGVAYMQRQHGYERVIEGLHQYYERSSGTYRVYLKLVGDGPEKRSYEKLVAKYHLQDYVSFYPTTTGQKLDELYNQSDLALAAFGMYKVGYYEPIGALKTRECLAKGIPMISGSPIDVLNHNASYAHIVPNDNSPVDMEDIISYYEGMQASYVSKKALADEMRFYACKYASMEAIMKPIVEFIEEGAEA